MFEYRKATNDTCRRVVCKFLDKDHVIKVLSNQMLSSAFSTYVGYEKLIYDLRKQVESKVHANILTEEVHRAR